MSSFLTTFTNWNVSPCWVSPSLSLHISHEFIFCTLHDEFALTRSPHMPQRSILLLGTSPFDSLTITFIFPRLTLIPLLSNAGFHFWNFSLRSSIVSAINAKSSVYRISFIKPSLVLSTTTSTTIANNGNDSDPCYAPSCTGNSSDNFVPLWLSFMLLDTGSSLPLPFFLVCFSFSLPIPSLFSGLHQKLFPKARQNAYTTCSYLGMPPAFFSK